MKILSTKKFSKTEIFRRLRETRSKSEDVSKAVREILKRTASQGDKALFEYALRFDKARLTSLEVAPAEIREAVRKVPSKVLRALKEAKANIEKFHTAIVRKKEKPIETRPGVLVWREFRPIEKVGLYVPGGLAAYPSTVLMLGVPAKVAGCKEIIMCSPPSPKGELNPAILAAASLCGITRIFKTGGAQAIAAMAYGTATIPKVSKIFGPGNQYVTTAKMLAFGEINIDMPAGPSEVAAIADERANPAWVAADLLSQLEHGEDSQCLLITFSQNYAQRVVDEMKEQMKKLSRKEIIKESFEKSFAVVVGSIDEACEIANEYASEHLEIISKHESRILKGIANAGSVFLGQYTSEPLGDYATGANHTLPTSGFAKMFSPLSTDSFGKMIQVQKVSAKGIKNLRSTVETLAAAEGLDAHGNAVTIRFL